MSLNNLYPGASDTAPPASSAAQQPYKLTALERNNLKWEAHKAEIRAIYLDQDKTLEETMQFFEQERDFKPKKRKWKVKIKEWGFEKNIPLSDMSFIVAKAEKRKAEGKDTTFYRNGILVERSKIEQFKKRKLITPGDAILQDVSNTPPQITYFTPKPDGFDEDTDTTNSQLPENILGHNLAPPSLEDAQAQPAYLSSLGASTHELLEIIHSQNYVLCSCLNDLLRLEPPASASKRSNKFLHQPINQVLGLRVFREEMNLAHRLRGFGLRQRAEKQYVKAIQHFLDNGRRLEEPELEDSLTEVFTYFKNSEGGDILASAFHCFLIWKITSHGNLLLSVSRGKYTAPRFLYAYILQRHRQLDLITGTNSLQKSMLCLYSEGGDRSFRQACLLFLRHVLPELDTLRERNEERLTQMRVYPTRDNKDGFNSMFEVNCQAFASRLLHRRETRNQILLAGITSDGFLTPFKTFQSLAPHLPALIDLKWSRIYLYTRDHRITAHETSVKVWLAFSPLARIMYQAVPVYSQEKGVRLDLEHSLYHKHIILGLVEHCRHLQTQNRWSELLSAIHSAYQAILLPGLGLPREFCSEQILLLKSALISIPRPLGQYTSLDEVEEIWHLDNMLLEIVIAAPRSLGWIEGEEGSWSEDENDGAIDEERSLDRDEDIVMRDEGSAGEVESSMDARSSNKYGKTFPESEVTGMSWDYSDLINSML